MPSSAVGPAGTPLITVSARGGCAHLCHGNTWVGEWDQLCHHQGAPADACGIVPPVAPLLTQLLVPAVGVAAPQELAWISFWILHLWKIIFSGNFLWQLQRTVRGARGAARAQTLPVHHLVL